MYWAKYIRNKKVLLRERKRHTARRVASTPYVVLTGYPPSWPGQGGTMTRYPPRAGYPPAGSPPRLPHGILGNVAEHYGIWVPPLWTDRQTRVKTLPSRRTKYAGGKYCLFQLGNTLLNRLILQSDKITILLHPVRIQMKGIMLCLFFSMIYLNHLSKWINVHNLF